jgi:hypothetical protein
MTVTVIVILTVMVVAALLFALFCYLHYHLQRKDFEAYQRIAESNIKLGEENCNLLYDLLHELKKIIENNKQ